MLHGAPDLRPIAGGTDLMVQITGELAPPPARVLDLWRLDELRGIAIDDGVADASARSRRTRSCAARTRCRAQPAGAGRGGGHHRRGPDPEPRHDRRQHRQRLARRRHAARAARRRCGHRAAAAAAGERTVAARDFWPGYRRQPRASPTSSCCAIRIPLAGGPPASLPQGRHAAGAGDLQGRARARVARRRRRLARRARGPRARWRRRPSAPTRRKACSRAPRRARRRPTTPPRHLPARSQPIDDVRSTADYRRVVTARILHRLLREAGGW